jgi:linoleoyl-CoA desaturase
MSFVTFKTKEHPFFDELKKRVDAYFEQTGKNRWGNWSIYLKSAILLSSFVALYVLLVFVDLPTWLSISLCSLMGLTLAGIGFNLMHDGAHGSYSNKPWLNEIMGYSLNIVGGDVQLWKTKHNMIHHSFTNIEGHDDDINIQPMLRTNDSQPRYWFHRFQHIYGYALYSLTYFSWIWRDDFQKYFTKQIGATKLRKFTAKQHIIFWATKLTYIFTFLVLPMMMQGVIATLLGYTIMTVVCGIVIAVVFQLAHVVENATFVNPAESNGQIETEWAVHQINTTSNFATRSSIVHWLTGGLNYQVEHHLFPRISHVHYPALSKIVKETCDKFGITYNEYKTVYQAVRSHTVHLKNIGRND